MNINNYPNNRKMFTIKSEQLYPAASPELSQKRNSLAPETADAFRNFSKSVFKEGALPEKTKQLIAVAVAHVTQCPYCIRSHTAQAVRKGASEQEIMEAVWVAAEMHSGAAIAHSNIALNEMQLDEKY
jgi:AhpD family alkylhydroperoxidase